MADLDGVTVAFDLDNTLLDPTGERYDAVTTEFLAQSCFDFDPDLSRDAYERVRKWGSVLARLGFANPLHDRGHVDGLSVLSLVFAANSDPAAGHADAVAQRDALLAFLDELEEVASASRRGLPHERLEAERSLRTAMSSPMASALKKAVAAASKPRAVREWSDKYDAIEGVHAVDDVHPTLQRLIDRGATCVVISQGRSVFQRKKIERLGLARLLAGRVLITQDARRIPGYEALNARLDALLVREDPCDELTTLWPYRCLLDVWGSKSPSFYARCLHALHGGAGGVETRLVALTTVARKDWTTRPLRFVMIGDRYEKDIRPVIDLLGSGTSTTVHLRAGKYNEGFTTEDVPEHVRPTHSLDGMSALKRFIENKLTFESVPTIEMLPAIAPEDWFDNPTLDFGMRCDLECVRNMAAAIIATRK